MRQGNGSELLGVNDPRSSSIGMIYVSPTDDRKSVLAAILTQEKLGRKQIAIVLPIPNKAFQRAVDFEDLKNIRKRKKLRANLIFIAPSGSGLAEFARQHRFTVYSSLESYTESLRIASDAEAGPPPTSEPRYSRVVTGNIAPASTPATPAEDTTTDDDEIDINPIVLGAAGGAAAGMVSNPHWQQNDPDFPEEFEVGNHAPEDADDLPPPITPVPTTPGGPTSPENADDNTAHLADDAQFPPPTNEPVPAGFAGGAAEPGIIKLPRAPKKTIELTPDTSVPPTPTRRTSAQRNSGNIATAAGAASLAAAGATASMSAPPSSAPARSTASGRNVTPQRAPQTGGPVGPTGPGRSGGGRGGNNRPQRSRRGILLLLVALLLLALLLTCGGVAMFQPAALQQVASNLPIVSNFVPQATVAITPDSQIVSKQAVVTGVTDQADAAQLQISAPQPIIANQSQATVKGTGHTKTLPVQAAGTLTFFNQLTSPQTVAAGTAFTVRNGVQIVSDQAAAIPAGNGTTNGSVTVPAHAVTAGVAGNIPAFTLQVAPCCATGIAVSNTGAFTGGQDPQDYNFIKQSDVDAVANPIKNTLVQQATSQLKAKIGQDEVLIQQPQCQPNVKADQQIGDHGPPGAQSTTVNVSVNCNELLYNQKQLQTLMENQLTATATSQYGQNYTKTGAVQVKPTITKINQGTSVIMTVVAKGMWVLNPTEAQKSDWAKLIVNKTSSEATSLLQGQKGINKVGTILMNGNTLPADPGKIAFTIEPVTGLQPITNPSVNTNPVINNDPNGENQITPEPGRGSKEGILVL